MQGDRMWRHFFVLTVILTVGFGCNFLEKIEKLERPESTEVITRTEITKEALKERLGAKGVKLASPAPRDKPNPLSLYVRFSTRNNDFLLNAEHYEYFAAMANTLREVFKEREINGVFIEGTNLVYKTITLPAYQSLIDDYKAKGIFVEDFEKLVDDLQREGFSQIELDIDESNLVTAPPVPINVGNKNSIKPANTEKTLSNSSRNDDTKSISGGVLNGKAIDLPKPTYPAAARAVRATGAVNVQVTVDEKGDVVSAEAVSGHPLLRASATMAARKAKFNPTLLSGKPVKVTGIIVYNFTPE